jgi:hypothetical protein
MGRFGDIDVSNHRLPDGSRRSEARDNFWLSFQKTKGPSDLFVQSNVWVPGGSTGWHTHDPSCTPQVYTVGMGLVDAGGDHIHLLRNEDSVEARTVAVQLIPAGATRRIDAEAPVGCPF